MLIRNLEGEKGVFVMNSETRNSTLPPLFGYYRNLPRIVSLCLNLDLKIVFFSNLDFSASGVEEQKRRSHDHGIQFQAEYPIKQRNTWRKCTIVYLSFRINLTLQHLLLLCLQLQSPVGYQFVPWNHHINIITYY